MLRHHPRTTLFPYTTLFRSRDKNRVLVRLAKKAMALPIPVDKPAKRVNPNANQIVFQSILVSFNSGDLKKSFAPNLLRAKPFRSEEHTSELQSRPHLVCRLL